MHIHRIEVTPTVSELTFDPMLEALTVPPDGPPTDRFLNTIPFRPQPARKSDAATDGRERRLPELS
jgi:hypothetical protein